MAKKRAKQKPAGLIQQASNWLKERETQKRDERERKKQERIDFQQAIIQRFKKEELARHEARLSALLKQYERGDGKTAELEAEIEKVRKEIAIAQTIVGFEVEQLVKIRQSDDGLPPS